MNLRPIGANIPRRLVLALAAASLLAACSKPQTQPVTSDDMSLGNPAAKVHVIEYASVACPVCGRWYKEVWPAFKAKYIDTGKVRYTLREVLVGGSEEQTIAASGFLLARCSGPSKYFSVVDAVFKSQPELFEDPHGVLLRIAESEGMTEKQFNACVQDDAALKALADRSDRNATQNQVRATPTFVVNGKMLDAGYHPLSDLDAAIQPLLGK